MSRNKNQANRETENDRLQAGIRHFNSGRYFDALACFRAVLRLQPQNTAARGFAADSLSRLGLHGSAARSWKRLLLDHPDDERARLGLVRTLLDAGAARPKKVESTPGRADLSPTGAFFSVRAFTGRPNDVMPRAMLAELRELRRALKRDPTDRRTLEALRGMAASLGTGQQPSSKLRLLRRILSLVGRPDAVTRAAEHELGGVALDWANQWGEQGRWEDAQSLARGALPRFGSRWPELRLILAESLVQTGRSRLIPSLLRPLTKSCRGLPALRSLILSRRYAEAFSDLEALLDSGPSENEWAVMQWPWGSVKPDMSVLSKREFGRDMRELARLAAAGSGGPWPHYYRGLLMRRCGQKGCLSVLDALRRFSAVRYGWMWSEIGRARMQFGDCRGALQAFGLALKHPAADWKCRGFRAELFVKLGQPAQALAEFRRAEKHAPPSRRGDILAWRGQVLLWLGRTRKAVEVLDAAARLGAHYAFAWRGAARVIHGRWRAALPDLDRALEFKPSDIEALIWRGEARRLAGDLPGALSDLDRAAVLSRSPWAYCHRGLVHAARGDDRALLADYRQLATDGRAASLLGRLPKTPRASKARRILEKLRRFPHGDCRSLELARVLLEAREARPAKVESMPGRAAARSNRQPRASGLTPAQKRQFLDHGWVAVRGCFPKGAAQPVIEAACRRAGCDLDDPSTWPRGRKHIEGTKSFLVRDFAPKAWAAIADAVGGEERIDGAERFSWLDSFVAKFPVDPSQAEPAPSQGRGGWHKDGDGKARHFLDSPEYGLLTFALWTDLQAGGGGTFLACESVAAVARYLAAHPNGVPTSDPDFKKAVNSCGGVVELTGKAGDVFLLHPYLIHAESDNRLSRPRFQTLGMVKLRAPLRFDRADGEHSLVEQTVLKALGVRRFVFSRARFRSGNA